MKKIRNMFTKRRKNKIEQRSNDIINKDNAGESQLKFSDYKDNTTYRVFHNNYNLVVETYGETQEANMQAFFMSYLKNVEKILISAMVAIAVLLLPINITAATIAILVNLVYTIYKWTEFTQQLLDIEGWELWMK